MGTTRKWAQGRGLQALTTALVLAVLAALLLAGTAQAAKPGKPTAKTPTGTITTTTPTFTWSKAARAATYEARAYKGSTLLVKKTGIARRSWKSSKVLPRGVALTWKVRGRKAGVNGPWSSSRTFRVAALSSAKAITAFSFEGLTPAVTGTVTQADHIIALDVPFGTDVTGLVATFTTDGAVVAVGSIPQESGVTANDFTSPVTYTVTAADASTQTYTVTVTVAAKPLAIGDAYQGGKVAYILQPGDADYVAGRTRGLIAATADQSTGIIWAIPAYQSTAVPGGTSTPIGAGSANTSAIVTQNGATLSTYAAGLCYNLDSGGYSDWYLPSANELDKLCLNQAAIGGFESAVYWSSSESLYNVANAWFQNFGVGFQSSWGKNTAGRVRAVRTFAPAGVATQIAVNAGDAQSATVSTAVATAPSVIIRDSANDPVANVSVTFAVASGGGSVTGATTTTNASGIATVGSWTLGATVGTNTLTATSPGLTGSPVTVSAAGIVTVGDAYQGGNVAYILQEGDPGYVAGQTRGLIAAIADQSTGIIWAKPAYQTTAVPGGTGIALGDGSANTTRVVSQNGAGSTYAAGLARAYSGGGYSDWYLPSKDELNKLYLNQAAIGGFATTSPAWYWSSSGVENGDGTDRAWGQDFSNSAQGYLYRSNTKRVRAVRAFPADSAKDMLTFSTPTSGGSSIDMADHTIALDVPFGTDVTGLVATFTTDGAVVAVGSIPQESGVTANDFTSPVTYTVTAADASTQTYTVTVTVAAPVIGQSYGGGKIAYVLQPGDPGYVAGQTRGLIAATADQGTDMRWWNGSSMDTGATGTGLGTGSANTTAIIVSQGATATSYAAGLARACTDGGYSDWYLPSNDELYKLYVNQAAIGGFDTSMYGEYWSSSQYTAERAWYYTFYNGFGHDNLTFNTRRVRAVRAFPADSAKAITAFSFEGLTPAVTGTVTQADHTIALDVPFGTDVTGLVATFTTDGAVVAVGSTVQASGVTTNDFTSPVTYTVTAADASTQTYSVTVTIAAGEIGQSYGGGKMAYILQPGEIGYVAG